MAALRLLESPGSRLQALTTPLGRGTGEICSRIRISSRLQRGCIRSRLVFGSSPSRDNEDSASRQLARQRSVG